MNDTRTLIINELINDITGPRNEREELPDAPLGWYISGILFPKNIEFDSEEDDRIEAGSDDGEESESAIESISTRSSYKQNSVGISCNVKPDIHHLDVDVRYAIYKKEKDENKGKTKWIREPVNLCMRINLDDKSGSYEIKPSKATIKWSLESENNYRTLTVFLYNDNDPDHENNDKQNKEDESKGAVHYTLINSLSIFQPQITIKSIDNNSPFMDASGKAQYAGFKNEMDETEKSLRLLFRNKHMYARGFNCATDWEKSVNPLYIKTVIIPVFSAKNIGWSTSDDKSRPMDIDMKILADAKTPAELITVLLPIADKYEKWIDGISSKINYELDTSNDDINLIGTAQSHIEKCRYALERIREGISLLEMRPDVFEAFKFANKAMLYQRSHYQFALAKFRNTPNLGTRPEPNTLGKYMWRPFQMAFILLNLKGIAERTSKEREITDLLWFPTGGGKTEAYLGISAFTMALRRINSRTDASKGNGVTVIMRYTLRLLTIQQFQRATALICACEIIRRENPKEWGEEPFLIGLWVGYKSTPNDFESASKNLKEMSSGRPLKESNPVQISFCPWCGSEITHRDFHADKEREWIIVHCSNNGCDFYHNNRSDITRALPILTVDQDIYRRCPSMVISTVDKFARMPWRPQSSAIFGYVSRYCPRHGYLTPADKGHQSSHKDGSKKIEVISIEPFQGPDLIIQDELHLIAGPLGTIVGLYETAVEYLSSRKHGMSFYKPKIIVSTATVKGVDYQVRKLFNRKITETFPPPGINVEDSFFWWEVDDEGRKFVGISSPSYSVKTANLRIYASILQKVFELKSEIQNIDPYWTVVGYFNSRRELGGSLRLLEDDVIKRIKNIVDLIDEHKGFENRNIAKTSELTGRIDSAEIPAILSSLENTVDSENAIDVLLATNMISVGVDVERLGLMVVTGQPKNTAEYIQAVGRVGRKKGAPGLIVTLYNPFRPRDLSHYENFMGYHSMLQSYVDPVSLTPFSDRALDRALHAVIISMIRLRITDLSSQEDARLFRSTHPVVKEIINIIEQRFLDVERTDKSKPDFICFSEKIKKILDQWETLLRKDNRLTYTKKNAWRDPEPGENILMKEIGEGNEDAFLTPGSMRDVEKEANLNYL